MLRSRNRLEEGRCPGDPSGVPWSSHEGSEGTGAGVPALSSFQEAAVCSGTQDGTALAGLPPALLPGEMQGQRGLRAVTIPFLDLSLVQGGGYRYVCKCRGRVMQSRGRREAGAENKQLWSLGGEPQNTTGFQLLIRLIAAVCTALGTGLVLL